MTAFLRRFGLLTALGALLTAGPGRADIETKPGQLIVEDKGKLFSEDAIRRAKDEFARAHSKTGRQAMLETLAKLPDPEQAKLKKIDPKDREAVHRFWLDFAKNEAKADRAKGVYILVVWDPGHVEVIVDQEMKNKGFTESNRNEVRDIFVKPFRDAKSKPEAEQTPIRDKALLSAVEYLARTLPGESADVKQKTKPAPAPAATKHEQEGHRGGGMGIGGWICLGIALLLGIWLVFGLVRAFAGGGYYGGGGYGPGYGYGGGGFFPSLMGGLFGAAAGMWMYDNFFGGHSSTAYGGDYGGGGYGDTGPTVDDTGAGDFSRDEGAGGDFDGGGDAGGDYGGGGDFGGG
ncbi:MAG: hypothetical protein J2P46_13965, partial [Zavarzinella sp.]|nr:hypothetical protein [Zavarzinella sp.]